MLAAKESLGLISTLAQQDNQPKPAEVGSR